MSNPVDVRHGERTFAPVPIPRPWWERLPMSVAVLLAIVMLLFAVALVIPVPFAVRAPGPTVDTLGHEDDVELIAITDAETYPSEGELRLTTVSVSGGPGYAVTGLRALRAWLDPTSAVVPKEVLFPDDSSREEVDEESQQQMTSSQENATVAALEALDYDIPTVLTVAGAVADGPSEGILQEGDVLTAITVDDEGTALTSFSQLSEVLAGTAPDTEVVVSITRDSDPLDVTIATADDGEGGSLLGILVDPAFEIPVDVQIQISDIGGSSAGTMFALGIMEKLTPGDETGGQVIAGTGTMSIDGDVGAIGGIVQKMNGALRDGATYFLAPLDNCDAVIGNEPAGLQVFAIDTLDEAWTAVHAIGDGDTSDLPVCS